MRRRILSHLLFSGVLLVGTTPSIRAQTLASPRAGVWYDPATAGGQARVSPRLRQSLEWTAAGTGVSWAELDIAVGSGPLRIHTILVRLRTDSLRAQLVQLVDRSGVRGAWTIDSANRDVRVALNAGQFLETGPWGWIVSQGRELAGPRNGPLAGAIAFDSAGRAAWYTDSDVAFRRSGRGDVVTAFQSYPRLLIGGRMPNAVRTGHGLDAGHRDARLAIGDWANHELVIALTRFGARETVVSRVPIGLTTRETAALMQALGSTNALMLDGGLSAQLLLREAPGAVPIMWHGARRVPVALVFHNR